MRLPVAAQPCFVVVSVALDDQRVAVPAADRIPLPARSRIFLELTAVHENHAIGEVVVEDRDGRRRLYDSLPSGGAIGLGSARQALIRRTRFPVFRLTLETGRVGRGLLVGRGEEQLGHRPIPYARQVNLPAGPARGGRREVWLPVSGPGNARSFAIEPLGSGWNRLHEQNERREK